MSRYLGCCRLKRIHPQDGAWSWLVCACAILINMLLIGFGISIGVVIPVLMKEFKSNREETAWVGSIAIALASGLLSPICCSLCDRFGCRVVAVCGSFICIVSLLSSSFATKLEYLYFTHGLLFGIGANFTYTTSFLIISGGFTKWRSLALCLVTLGPSTGILIFGPFLQFMIDSFGWRVTFRVIGSISVVAATSGFSFSSKQVNQENQVNQDNPVNQENQDKQVNQDNAVNQVEKGNSNSRNQNKVAITNCNSIVSANNDLHEKENDEATDILSSNTNNDRAVETLQNKQNQICQSCKGKYVKRLRAYCSVWRTPTYTVIIVSSTLAHVVESLPYFNLVKHCQELGFSADSVADLYIYQGTTSSINRILGGILLGLNIVQSKHLYQFCLFANGLVTLFLRMIHHYYGFVIYVVIFGASDGMFCAVLTVLVIESVNANARGPALGMHQLLNCISLLLGPPLAGWIADIHNSYNPVFYMSGTISILAGLMVFLLYRRGIKVTPDLESISYGEETYSEKVENKDMKINFPSSEYAFPRNGNRPQTFSFPAELAISLRERSLTNEMMKNYSNGENQESKQTTEVVHE